MKKFILILFLVSSLGYRGVVADDLCKSGSIEGTIICDYCGKKESIIAIYFNYVIENSSNTRHICCDCYEKVLIKMLDTTLGEPKYREQRIKESLKEDK